MMLLTLIILYWQDYKYKEFTDILKSTKNLIKHVNSINHTIIEHLFQHFYRTCIMEHLFESSSTNGNFIFFFLSATRYTKYKKINLSHDTTKPTKWVCAQRRLRSAWPSAQSDQSLRCPHEETMGHWLPTERTAKTLIAGRTVICFGFVMSWLIMQVIYIAVIT